MDMIKTLFRWIFLFDKQSEKVYYEKHEDEND